MDINASYQDALQYLYERLPMFSKIGKDAIKKDLINIRKFCDLLNNPQEHFASIHIAGTNGKGSTSHMLAAVLQHAGYKVGLYTSPHLLDFRERVRINGRPISKEQVIDFLGRRKSEIEEIAPSFFEMTVAMAFEVFAAEKVDIAVIETGLGGRLDSTNIITPVLSIITNISYDHKDLLGNTLQEIAKEKAGIIKDHVPVLIGEQQEELSGIFFGTALQHQSTVYYAEALWDLVRTGQDTHFQYFKAVHKARREVYSLRSDLQGIYQQHNIKTVLAAAEVLAANQGLELSIPGAIEALAAVKKTTGLRGRWDILSGYPIVIADVAHNPAGLKEVLAQWANVQARRKHIIVGFVKDKDIKEALGLFPESAIYHFCNARIPRALPAAELSDIAAGFGLHGTVYASIADATEGATVMMDETDALLITGSFFVAGEAIEYLAMKKQRPADTGNAVF